MPRDEAYILDMLRTARRIAEAGDETTWEDLSNSWKAQAVLLHQLMILGEAVKRLSDEFRTAHTEVPWRQIARMRDHLIHRYEDVNLEEVWRTVKRDIPVLISFLEKVAPRDDSSENARPAD